MFEKGHKKMGGRTKGSSKSPEFKEMMRALTPDAVNVLKEIMNNPEAEENSRIRAAQIIIEHSQGKPVQRIGGEDMDEPFKIIVETVKANDGRDK